MPRKIVTPDGVTFRFQEYDLSPLSPREVRVRVTFAAPKHGTEAVLYSGENPHERKQWDSTLRMFLPRPESEVPLAPRDRSVGNMVVGEVLAVGSEVTRFAPGDRVFGYGPVQEVAQITEERVWPLENLADEDAVCVDPAHVAFVAVRDGNVRIGDTVAIYGLGAIGLMAVQIARAGGALRVYGVDPIALRRECAMQSGADAVFDPIACDSALEIKRATDKHGVDVSIETSGNGRALNDAIRCIRQCGKVVHLPWGPKNAADLHLNEEFHTNRVTLIGSQAWEGWGNPDRDYPLWDTYRAFEAVIALFRAGRLTGKGVVKPIVPFAEAPGRLADAFARPETSVKIGISFA